MFEIFNLTIGKVICTSDGRIYRYDTRAEAEKMARLCWDGRRDVVVRPVGADHV